MPVPRQEAVLGYLEPMKEDALSGQARSVDGAERPEHALAERGVVEIEPVVIAREVDPPHLHALRREAPLAPHRRQRLAVGGDGLVEDAPPRGERPTREGLEPTDHAGPAPG